MEIQELPDIRLNIEDYFTVDEFISICEDDYGSEIIKELKECWNAKK